MLKTDYKWQLINDSITDGDKKALTDFINTPNQKFTNGVKVREFEAEWSKWAGVRCSKRIFFIEEIYERTKRCWRGYCFAPGLGF